MHTLEPYYRWRNLYCAEEDVRSPFYGREHSELYYTDTIYNHYIHPQWDNIGSPTLYMKLLFTSYTESFCIIELMGEWNDCLHNDIMFLKRDIIDSLIQEGITKFILIGENVLNFHSSDDCYYEEWYEDIEDGWIAMVNFREHLMSEFIAANIDSYFLTGGSLNAISWRTLSPQKFFKSVDQLVQLRIG